MADTDRKLTMHAAPPEPVGILQGYGVVDQTPVLVWECELCVALVTDLASHKVLQHATATQ